jgi:hypothetical protein
VGEASGEIQKKCSLSLNKHFLKAAQVKQGLLN